MAHAANPTITKQGVAFTVVTLDCAKHPCLISKEALESLSPHRAGAVEEMEIFRAFEARICGVARRMIAANVKGSPLTLEARSFH